MVDFYYFVKSVKGATFHFRTTVNFGKIFSSFFLRLKPPHFSTTCTNNCGKTFRKSFEFVKVFFYNISYTIYGTIFFEKNYHNYTAAGIRHEIMAIKSQSAALLFCNFATNS